MSCRSPTSNWSRGRRGAKTVIGGVFASTFPALCQPFFDAVVVGDAEGAVPEVFQDFRRGELQRLYVSRPYYAGRIPVPRLDLVADQQGMPHRMRSTDKDKINEGLLSFLKEPARELDHA